VLPSSVSFLSGYPLPDSQYARKFVVLYARVRAVGLAGRVSPVIGSTPAVKSNPLPVTLSVGCRGRLYEARRPQSNAHVSP
jgi:hypothetical protein